MKRTRLEEVTRLLVNTALGMEKADLVVRDGRAREVGGGLVTFQDGKTISLVELPIAGLMSDEMPVVCRKIEKLQQAWKKLGCTMESPFMNFSLLALPVLPELRATDKGLANVKNFKFIPLFV